MLGTSRRRIGTPALMGLLVVGLVLTMSLAVAFGAVSVPFTTVWKIGAHKLLPDLVEPDWSKGWARIVWEIRFPRVILGAFVGAGLAVVGAVLQAATRNPLADPYLFGVSAGAALGAVAVIVHVGNVVGVYTLPLAASAGAIVSLLTVVAIGLSGTGLTTERLILAGVAVSFVLMAMMNFLIFLGDQRAAHSVVFWMLGGLGLARWSQLWVPFVVLLGGLSYLIAHARALNTMMVGEESAVTLGVDVTRMRLKLFIAAALITGILVAISGAIGFVGLMIPHVVRRFVGADNRRLLPVCALVGAIFVIWVDVLARVILAPQELPIGIITAGLGGVFFVWLMRRK